MDIKVVNRIMMTEALPPADTRSRFYAPQIDGLRFFAALLVIVHHSPAVPGLALIREIGWIGVDLFLCISAFLLTRLIRLEIKQTGSLRVRHFFIRRALRIWPLYIGYAAVMCLLGSLYFGLPIKTTGGWMLAHLSFSANFMTALTGFSPVPFTAHLWTISLEEQAYFVIPFLMIALSRAERPGRWIVVATASVIGLLTAGRLGLWLNGVTLDAIFVTPFRADGLVLGAAIALHYEDRVFSSKAVCWSLALVILAGWALLTLAGSSELAALWLFPPLIGCCALIFMGTLNGAAWLGWRPLAYLGKISFGIYVYHLLAISVVDRVLKFVGIASPGLALLGTILLSILISVLSYRLYETPFLRLKERFAVIASRPV